MTDSLLMYFPMCPHASHCRSAVVPVICLETSSAQSWQRSFRGAHATHQACAGASGRT
jgi:hypothetical protein